MPWELDHIAVCAETLEDGVAAVEAALGVTLAPGGKHALMSTHNRLLSLGPGVYLEVIAIDPSAPDVPHPRWFDLDNFTGTPRVSNWIARVPDLTGALAAAPAGTGAPTELERGDLRWQMAVPANGRVPFDGCFPALIRWHGAAHPAARLPDAGIRLKQLVVTHPDAGALAAALADHVHDGRVVIEPGAHPGLRACFATPGGDRWL